MAQQQALNACCAPSLGCAATLISCCVALQVCDREDSETYAKRTITEIETCLGFTFHGAAEEEAPETITNAELEVGRMQMLPCSCTESSGCSNNRF
jgi:hypothetical protein